jgi:hypothetical protein
MTVEQMATSGAPPSSSPTPRTTMNGHGSTGSRSAAAQAWLPAPPPEMVRAARALLTPRYALGVDAFLWESRQRPLSDLAAIDAVIAAGDRAQRGTSGQPPPTDIAAALVVLAAARLDMDQSEARLLNAAYASGMSSEQIAAILDLSLEQAEERHRQLKPRLDEPIAENPPSQAVQPPATKRKRRPGQPHPGAGQAGSPGIR